MATSTALSVVLDVFQSVATWFSTAINTVIGMFYAEGALTFLGVLAVAGLAVSVVFLQKNTGGRFCSTGV